MITAESARFAWRGVTANKTRSALTTLGILIGVAAVIVLVAVGAGSSRSVQESISSLGSNTLTVNAGSSGGAAQMFGGGGAPSGDGRSEGATDTKASVITMADAKALTDKNTAPDVLGVAPVVTPQSVTATYNGSSHSVATFTGSTPSYLKIDNSAVSHGRSFTDVEYTAHDRVAVLGLTVAKDLVGGNGSGAVGKKIAFNGKDFKVVGILAKKGSTGPQDQDDRVVAPLTAVQDTLTGYGDLDSISVKATSAATTETAQTQVEGILDSRHDVTPNDRDYSVFNASSILSAATSSNDTFTVLLGAVAAISLLVGGIGVMNIMLVTVTERTREIGIRKAIGASRSDIIGQFLLESILLSGFGAVVGVAVGLAGSQFKIVGVEPVVAPYSVALAFFVAIATGLFFGLYPANRAASLRPIDALRYE